MGKYCEVCHHGVNTHLVQHQGQLQRARDVEEEKRRAEEERRLLAPAARRTPSRTPSRQRSESASSNSNMDTVAADNSDQSVVVDINNLPGNQVSSILDIDECTSMKHNVNG